MMTRAQPVVAIYPGSFDPITKGHEDVARRSLRIADRVLVGVACTASPAKRNLFSVEERLGMVQEVFQDDSGIEACQFEGLLVDFAREVGAHFIIRGLRAVSDFEYEFQMAQMNRELWSEAETVFLTPDQRYSFLSASLVREVSRLGGDVSRFVSEPVLRRLTVASGE
jgi:pantetheine-phosphate adenylyltransferase